MNGLPIITGKGAEQFHHELQTMEYPDEIKEFYKGSKELATKLFREI